MTVAETRSIRKEIFISDHATTDRNRFYCLCLVPMARRADDGIERSRGALEATLASRNLLCSSGEYSLHDDASGIDSTTAALNSIRSSSLDSIDGYCCPVLAIGCSLYGSSATATVSVHTPISRNALASGFRNNSKKPDANAYRLI